MARFVGYRKTDRPGCFSYAAGTLLGLVLGGLAGFGPGYAAGAASLSGPWNPVIRWLGPAVAGWFGTAQRLAAFAGAVEFAFFGALIGAAAACALVAARVPLTLVTFGLSLLALAGVLVLLAAAR
jgi:hypothetical protein